MPPDDPTSCVVFVAHDEIDPGGFEELPQPPERPALRRWRIPLTIGSAVVTAALVVLAIVTRHASSPSPAAADRAPPPPPLLLTQTQTQTPPASRGSRVTLDPATGRTMGNPPAIRLGFLGALSAADIAAARDACPRLVTTCVTTGEAPTDVLRAVHAAFPRATHLVVLSDIAYHPTSGGRSLAFRRISARSGPARIAVEIRPPRLSDASRAGISNHAGVADERLLATG